MTSGEGLNASATPWHWSEPLPQVSLKPGDLIYSPGASLLYEILSYPFCRLFADEQGLTPNANESAWHQDATGRWRKAKGGNYLSYEVCIANAGPDRRPFVLTVRWQATPIAPAMRRGC